MAATPVPYLGAGAAQASCTIGDPVYAAFKVSIDGGATWTVAPSVTVPRGTEVRFRAVRADGSSAWFLDADFRDGAYVPDTISYSWDWATENGVEVNATGVVVAHTYWWAGRRTVRLTVDDGGFCFNDPADTAELVIDVPLTYDTDHMASVSSLSTGLLASELNTVGYTLNEVDTGSSSFEEVTYWEDLPVSDRIDKFNAYRHQNGRVYVVGGVHRKTGDTGAPGETEVTYGVTYGGGDAMVFLSTISNYFGSQSSQVASATTLHEPGCHRSILGAIDHCSSGSSCAFESDVSGTSVCTSCRNELRAYLVERLAM
jgi:hypothetical protein